MPIPASPVSKSTHPKPAARAKGRRPTPLRGLGICVLALLGMASAGLAQAADAKAKKPTMQQVLESSKPADWRALDPASTLYMELPGGRVVIEQHRHRVPSRPPFRTIWHTDTRPRGLSTGANARGPRSVRIGALVGQVCDQALPRMRLRFVPQTGHWPLAMRRPLSDTTTLPSASRLALHFTQ